MALAIRARVTAVLGDEEGSRRDAVESLAIARSQGIGSGLTFAHATLGLLLLGIGRIDEAIVELEAVERRVGEDGLEEPTLIPWAPDLILPYMRAGRTDDASRVLATLRRQAEAAGTPAAGALLARCRGITEEDFDAAFQEALRLDDLRPMPFERARTLLAYGRRLRRARRRQQARDRLREAQAGFARLGALPWAEQARGELRAAGARRRQAHDQSLTQQELRVAAAVARGASNREVAAELFLASKTVESHLRQIYRKLGVRTRTQLVAMLAQDLPRRAVHRPASGQPGPADLTPVTSRATRRSTAGATTWRQSYRSMCLRARAAAARRPESSVSAQRRRASSPEASGYRTVRRSA